MRTFVVSLGVLFLTVSGTRAYADDPHERSVAAFEVARRHMEAGDCPSAIPYLEESLRQEASVGARFSLADCVVKSDPYAAWWHLRSAALLAFLRHDERFKVAQERAAALLPSLARIGLDVPFASVETKLSPLRPLASSGKKLSIRLAAG